MTPIKVLGGVVVVDRSGWRCCPPATARSGEGSPKGGAPSKTLVFSMAKQSFTERGDPGVRGWGHAAFCSQSQHEDGGGGGVCINV